MPDIVPPEIERYAELHTSPENPLLSALAKATREKTEVPRMQVGHVEGSFLRLLTRAIEAKHVLEIGTFTGYSALCMAEGMPQGGKLITCDVDESAAKIAREHWKQSHHGKKIVFEIGPALDTLKKFRGPFDLVFIDADKENYLNYWNAVLPKVRKGGMILVDNVLWSGRVLDPKAESDKAIVRFNEAVSNDRRVELVMLTLRDGVTMAVKK